MTSIGHHQVKFIGRRIARVSLAHHQVWTHDLFEVPRSQNGLYHLTFWQLTMCMFHLVKPVMVFYYIQSLCLQFVSKRRNKNICYLRNLIFTNLYMGARCSTQVHITSHFPLVFQIEKIKSCQVMFPSFWIWRKDSWNWDFIFPWRLNKVDCWMF
jgi:hypothetical protein